MGITRREVLALIDECEKKGEFDKHVDPVNYDIVLPVDGSFKYIDKPLSLRAKYFFERTLVVAPFAAHKNRFVLKTKVNGRENLKGIDAAIVTSNHVNIWDCLAQRYAFRGHTLDIVAASFNNQSGFLGEMMRATRMFPLGADRRAMHNFTEAISSELKHGRYVLFYPEQAMWWNYEKPRPYKDGAFSLAVRNNVPVIPTFITFRDSGKKDAEGLPIKYFTVNILPPVYPSENTDRRESVARMMDEAFNACKKVYEDYYGRKLEYTTETE